MKDYLGNPLQVRGAEQYILQNGKGGGMHFLNIRNGLGLEVWISLDRAGDVSRVNYLGDNIGYFAPCGYVAPSYYDSVGTGFLKSFTAGFFTTCGLSAVGSPCFDDGEELPMHGTVSNTPATLYSVEENDNGITVKLKVSDCQLFGNKLILHRKYYFSYTDNSFEVTDNTVNESDRITPFMILYHCNMGYPLLSEKATLKIPHNSIHPIDEYAEKFIDTALKMEKPQAGYEECCYSFDVKENAGISSVGIFNSAISKGLVMSYEKKNLPCFTEWKMMGKNDYALGLEPGNCTPEGRDVMRKNGTLKFLQPGEQATTGVKFKFINDINSFI